MPDLRPMLPADVDAATEMVLGHGWGVRRDWLAYAASSPACVPVVAELEGRIIGTGVGTANGPVGWIGTIFVDQAHRGRGLGRALTEAVIDRLEARGCRSLCLVATTEGRRLYERMGFEVQTHYRILEAPGLSSTEPGSDGRVRAFRPTDLAAMLAIDREGTGEDRGHLIQRLATPTTARVRVGPGGTVDGFVVRAPWGGGATIARTIDAAMDLVAARRVSSGPEGRVRVGLLADNVEGLARIAELGFTDQWSAPRMIRGEPRRWHPEWIWGQFNHAVG